jgi:hypothetical protein
MIILHFPIAFSSMSNLLFLSSLGDKIAARTGCLIQLRVILAMVYRRQTTAFLIDVRVR